MMDIKSKMHNIPHSGGKAVINLHKVHSGRKEILKDYAQILNNLKGKYLTAVDSGTTAKDMDIILKYSPYVLCHSNQPDASKHTALGVYMAIKASCEHYLKKSMSNIKISIQGLGSVGIELIKLLKKNNASVIAADKCQKQIKKALLINPKIEIVDPEDIYSCKTDIFSPCALGNSINTTSIKSFECKIICGAANNQLASINTESFLSEKGIFYMPDFLVNAGGLIYAAGMYQKNTAEEIKIKVEEIYKLCLYHIQKAEKQNISLLSWLNRELKNNKT